MFFPRDNNYFGFLLFKLLKSIQKVIGKNRSDDEICDILELGISDKTNSCRGKAHVALLSHKIICITIR